MQHVQCIIFAILVAGCLFHVKGQPFDRERPESSNKYLGIAKSFASRGAQLVGSGLSTGAGMVGRSIISGVGAGTEFAIGKLSKALSCVDNKSLTSALGLPADLSKADMYEVFPKLIIAQAQSSKGCMNYETAIVFLERLSVMVPTLMKTAEAFQAVSYAMNRIRQQVHDGTPIDSKALMEEAANMYFDDGDKAWKKRLTDMSPMVFDAAFGDMNAAWAITYGLLDRNAMSEEIKRAGHESETELLKAIIAQVSTYANLVKTANNDKSFASLGAGTIGSGIVRGLGSATEYSLGAMSKAFSSVDSKSLTKALGLPADFSKTLADKVDVPAILEKLTVGQTQPGKGAMNYETSLVFLERLSFFVPPLRKTVNAFQTTFYVMNKIQKYQREGKKIDANAIMRGAVDVYFMDVDKAYKKKLVALAPEIKAAALGDKAAASKVAKELAEPETIYQGLNAMGYKKHSTIIRKVIDQVSTDARLVRAADSATQRVKSFFS